MTMGTLWRRSVIAAGVAVVVVGAGVIAAAPAQAQTVENGTFVLSGDPDEFITGGQSFSFATPTDTMGVSSVNGNSGVGVGASDASGQGFRVTFGAPEAQPLVPGTYTNATRWPFNTDGPGLALEGPGRACNEVTGSFTIIDVTFGPSGYVQTLDATFEHHCEGGDLAARGEVHVSNPPAPPLLNLGTTIARSGQASLATGAATVRGTVTCDKPARVSVFVTVAQQSSAGLKHGSNFADPVDCTPDTAATWRAEVVADFAVPFLKGNANVEVQSQALDPDTDLLIRTDATRVVKLKSVRR